MKKGYCWDKNFKKICTVFLITYMSVCNFSVAQVLAQSANAVMPAQIEIAATTDEVTDAAKAETTDSADSNTVEDMEGDEDKVVLPENDDSAATTENGKPVLTDSAKTKPAAEDEIEKIPQPVAVASTAKDIQPKEEKTSSSSKLLYVGIGVGAAVALAAGLSGGGSSSLFVQMHIAC